MSIIINKLCGCGVLYEELPAHATKLGGLYWFNCSCNSTLAHPVDDLTWRRTTQEAREVHERRLAERKANNKAVMANKEVAPTIPVKPKRRLTLVTDVIDKSLWNEFND